MKRDEFLKRLGVGAAIVTINPSVLADIPAVMPEKPAKVLMLPIESIPDGYSVQDIIDIWHQTGTIMYRQSSFKPEVIAWDDSMVDDCLVVFKELK